MTQHHASSIDHDEITRFDATSHQWWDYEGPYALLHAMNPLRIKWLRQAIAQAFPEKTSENAAVSSFDNKPLLGLKILDVGCGGGLVCEPMCRLGATVTGIDATAANVDAAKAHAAAQNLAIDYRHTSAEALVAEGETYDVVVAFEIVEHVTDPEFFVASCARLVAPGGALAMSTLNRTWLSYLLGVVVAEKVLGWVPHGTHDWNKFIRPRELKSMLQQQGLKVEQATGFKYRPLQGTWCFSDATVMNYALAAYRQK